ncbi:MAG: hypothetical protein JSU65_12450, partial [Candidatus Zixiibacteriota bacterium]
MFSAKIGSLLRLPGSKTQHNGNRPPSTPLRVTVGEVRRVTVWGGSGLPGHIWGDSNAKPVTMESQYYLMLSPDRVGIPAGILDSTIISKTT